MWFSHRSRLVPVRLWHYLFDGTVLCWCARSRKWHAAIEANYRITGPGELWLTRALSTGT